MRRMESLLRRAVADYDMIEAGDHVGVGLSGGKDSLALLTLLAALRRYYPKPFTLTAFTLDLGFKEGGGFDEIAAYCERLDVPFVLKTTEIGPIVFDARQEKNPCALCAKMRRGALNTALLKMGLHTIALGHHYDDAAETFLMNLVFEGRIGCFQPVTYLDRMGVTQIRPLLYVRESEARAAAARLALPVVESHCPADGSSRREEVKNLIARLEESYPGLSKKIFGAVQRYPLFGWEMPPKEQKIM